MASVKAIFNFGEELTIRSETPPGGGQLMRFVQTNSMASIFNAVFAKICNFRENAKESEEKLRAIS